ncbi:MAG TPA: 2,4'-dihydroxyacetophenone dioxygenase family protein [Kofleriaceae bacterium]
MQAPHPIHDAGALPWVPLAPGFAFKVLRAPSDDDTWVELLRLEPGTVIPRHRHTGEVHAYTLAGHRELIDTGTVVGPGSYVFEPAGNVDSWRAVGDVPLIIFVTVRGAIEYLDDRGEVLRRSTALSAAAHYREGCA